ncbi:MAG: hypothetical protein DSY82_02780 [Flavobacteriia bacterium]|nr:MAG: hypothetical protein DSY82_02780 [Flavobacteriia bacterium]
MKYSLLVFICIAFLSGKVHAQDHSVKMNGTLRVSKINPRYFTNNSGQAIYLTGSHTWNNLVDMSPKDAPEKFDFPGYLQWLKKYHHNFIRLWNWELLNWNTSANREKEPKNLTVVPHPWLRTGPGVALDGKPKFNLDRFDPAFFKRLKKRVKMAEKENIYVSIMLFEGWGLQFSPNAFKNHPFHPDNNINGINGDANGDGRGVEIHTLANREITRIQENYVKKVLRTLKGFDNVLYEIGNEMQASSTEWQYHMIAFIKDYEKTLPKQHPVGMTFQHRGGSNSTLFNSRADWISPNPQGGYRDNPPPGKGDKVIITDTDHLWGIGGNQAWVWKSFLSGLNPIFMDSYKCKILVRKCDSDWAEPIRKSMGYTLLFARRMDLIHMKPEPGLVSSGYCLSNKAKEYLVYLPEEKKVEVDLTEAGGLYQEEWFNPDNGETVKTEVMVKDEKNTFISPFNNAGTVLYLKKDGK